MSATTSSPSPLGGEGWGEGCFLHEKHQTPFAPSARASGCAVPNVPSSVAQQCASRGGPAPTSPLVILSAAKDLASPPASETGRRALARVPNPPERLSEVFRLRRVTFLDARKVTKRTFPGVCAVQSQGDWTVPCASRPRRGPSTGHPWPDDGRIGILPRPRLRAADPPPPPMLGAARRGGESKAKATSKAPLLHHRHSRESGNPGAEALLSATDPSPWPSPPRGEGTRGMGRALLIVLPCFRCSPRPGGTAVSGSAVKARAQARPQQFQSDRLKTKNQTNREISKAN